MRPPLNSCQCELCRSRCVAWHDAGGGSCLSGQGRCGVGVSEQEQGRPEPSETDSGGAVEGAGAWGDTVETE